MIHTEYMKHAKSTACEYCGRPMTSPTDVLRITECNLHSCASCASEGCGQLRNGNGVKFNTMSNFAGYRDTGGAYKADNIESKTVVKHATVSRWHVHVLYDSSQDEWCETEAKAVAVRNRLLEKNGCVVILFDDEKYRGP